MVVALSQYNPMSRWLIVHDSIVKLLDYAFDVFDLKITENVLI